LSVCSCLGSGEQVLQDQEFPILTKATAWALLPGLSTQVSVPGTSSRGPPWLLQLQKASFHPGAPAGSQLHVCVLAEMTKK
jgi:hypothetical protein